ncbi:hypothetical protein AJ79_02229 [Helicocarpus griseus UAMH5409]|uniref:Uncharacterized protein n=1 Tax=Helicocarpus griseus UAMH5409 TaxID=1447875 RepID=A0A2B7Y2C8_9EURO|nr:hypothetical protein AJ79_02229 [Helicocarpus griseus UAMH5409]
MATNPATTTTTSPFSPASLLWAHQLRREHTVLVSRLDSLEKALESSSAEAVSRVEVLKGELGKRLEGVEEGVRMVEGEMGNFKGLVGEIKGQAEGLAEFRGVVEGWQKEREGWEEKEKQKEEERRREIEEGERKREGVETELREVVEEVRGLKEVVQELRAERQAERERAREREVEKEREGENPLPDPNPYLEHTDNQLPRSSSLPPIPHHTCNRQQQPSHRLPSTISGTPTVSHLPTSTLTRSSLPPPPPPPPLSPYELSEDSILVPDSMPRQPSPELPYNRLAAPPEPPRSPPQPPYSAITHNSALEHESPRVPCMFQGIDESVELYLARGEAVVAGFPRREENRVVLRFWEGLRDEVVKRGLEERLESEGWRWEVARGFVEGLNRRRVVKGNWDGGVFNSPGKIDASGCQNGSTVTTAIVKKRRRAKRRRFIPVIWPVEEEGDVDVEGERWFVMRNGLT